MRNHHHLWAAFVAVLLLTSSALCQAPGNVIAYTDQMVAGSGGALRYGTFGYGVLNNFGTVSFIAGVKGPSVTTADDVGIFVGSELAFAMVGRDGQAAPGVVGAQFDITTNDTPVVNSAGSIAFQSGLTGNGSGIWTTNQNGLVVVAATGLPAPGTAATFRSGGNTTMNSTGQVAFQAGIRQGTTNSVAIFGGSPDALSLLARTGVAAPGAGSGVQFQSVSNPAINGTGTVIFDASLAGTGISDQNNRGIWAASITSGTNLLIREGDAVGGVAPGIKLTRINGEPSLNAMGEIAFGGSVGVTTDVATALFFGLPGEIRVIAMQGDLVEGVTNLQIGPMFPQTVMNGRGQVILNTLLAGPGVSSANDDALFIVSASGKQLLARAGDAAPGTVGGVQFGNFGAGYDLNRYGQVAIRMVLQGNVNQSNDRGVWALDPFGQFVKIAREGDTITLPDGATRTIAGNAGAEYYHDTGVEGGRRSGLNDAGQIITSLTFTDGSDALYLSRVGGSARASTSPPTLGPAIENAFNLLDPLSGHGATSAVSGDIGYLKFRKLASTLDGTTLELNFSESSTAEGILQAMVELERGAELFGYSATRIGGAPFDVALQFEQLGDNDNFFYWNFANIPAVDLIQVRLVPEPTFVVGYVVGMITIVARRRLT